MRSLEYNWGNIKVYSEIINKAIIEVKDKFPQYKAASYSKTDFDKLINRLEKRREKYLPLLNQPITII